MGSAGNALAAVAWGTCGEPAFGDAGVQLFAIDAGGTVTLGDDLLGNFTDQGVPPFLCQFAISGENHYVARFRTEWTLYSASDTLSPYLEADAFVEPGFPLCRASAIDGDAAGETFASVSLAPNQSAPSYIEKLDSAGTTLWTVPSSPAQPGPWPQPWRGVYAPTLVADGGGGVYLSAVDITGAALDLGCGPIPGASVTRFDAAGHCLWSIGSPAFDPYFTGSILPTEAGQVYIASSFQGTLDLGCGPMTSGAGTSSFVAKLDACGACSWSRTFATPSLGVDLLPGGDLLLSTPYSGTIDLGGGPLQSAGITDVAVGRLSAAGAPLWSRSFGAAGATVSLGRATADATGGVVLVLGVTGTADFGGGAVTGSGALLKLDAAGALRWQRAPFSGLVASDACGAVLAASDCTSCAPGNGWGVSVVKLSP